MHISIFLSSPGSSQTYLGLPPVKFAKLIKMLPSNHNCNNGIVSYTDQSIFHRPFFNDTNQTNSKEEDPSLSFFHFPSSFIHYHEIELDDYNFFLKQIYYDGLLLPHHEPVTPDDITVHEIAVDMVDSSNKSTESNDGLAAKEFNESVICNNQKPSGKRSSSNKDRHSKINTAKGPRDRRMRLSLDVARKFFDLQDMLGYDKASKTVEWLLIQAKPEIKKLERCLPEANYCGGVGAKSTSEGEVEAILMDKAAVRGKLPVKQKRIKHTRKTIRPHAKDSREKARARARERTSKKMWSRKFDHELKLTAVEVKNKEFGTQTQNKNHSLEVLAEVDQEPLSSNKQPVNLGNQEEEIVDDALVIMEKWIPVSNYLQNIEIPQEHQFPEFQYFGEP